MPLTGFVFSSEREGEKGKDKRAPLFFVSKKTIARPLSIVPCSEADGQYFAETTQTRTNAFSEVEMFPKKDPKV